MSKKKPVKKPSKKKPTKYEKKFVINASFEQVLKAAIPKKK